MHVYVRPALLMNEINLGMGQPDLQQYKPARPVTRYGTDNKTIAVYSTINLKGGWFHVIKKNVQL